MSHRPAAPVRRADGRPGRRPRHQGPRRRSWARPSRRSGTRRPESLKALGRERVAGPGGRVPKADDAALRERATALWETIQHDLMTRPSLVRLDFPGQVVGNVLDELMKQTGLSLRSDAAAGSFTVKNRPPDRRRSRSGRPSSGSG